MSSDIEQFRQSLVAAVQAELDRHASAVVAEVDRLREESQRDRDQLWKDLSERVRELTESLDRTRAALEQRVDESESRQTRRLEDLSSGLEGLVSAAARPALQDVRDDQQALSHKVDALDTNLRKFDEQAARMVTYFTDLTQSMEQRQDQASAELRTEVAGQVEGLKKLVDDNDSAIRRFQNEVGQSVSQRIGEAEDRFNNRLLAAESRIKEDSGQKIADIDAHVGRVSAGLDETMTVLNDRIGEVVERFDTIGDRIDQVEQSVKGIDQDAIEELKDKMSAAAGEAMLVRIEMERLEKNVNERSDSIVVRINEVEAALADATMDVSTAVQLDRLEEIERALLELDPNKFVLKDEVLQKSTGGADDIPDHSGVAPADSYADGH